MKLGLIHHRRAHGLISVRGKREKQEPKSKRVRGLRCDGTCGGFAYVPQFWRDGGLVKVANAGTELLIMQLVALRSIPDQSPAETNSPQDKPRWTSETPLGQVSNGATGYRTSQPLKKR